MKRCKLLIVCVLLCLLSSIIAAQTATQGMTIDNLNVRSGPGTEHGVIHKILARTDVMIEARNDIGNWVIVHTADQAIRGWVASRYVVWDAEIVLGSIPISNELFEFVAPPIASDETHSPPENGNIFDRLLNTPVLHNMNTSTIHAIYAQGIENGNRPTVFIKIGDSISAVQPFFWGYGEGQYNLGQYQHLQQTINFFSQTSPNPFSRNSFAAQSGFTSHAMFDATWVDPEKCTDTPLRCEYISMKPSVAIIFLGSLDIQYLLNPQAFENNMRHLINDLIGWGVIPVLTTFPRDTSHHWEGGIMYSTIVLNMAQEYDIPLINLWRAARDLPENGLHPDRHHLSESAQANPFNFTGEEALYGVNLRNLLTLQALDELRQNVLR